PGGCRSSHTVLDGLGAIFLVVPATFVIGLRIAVKTGRNFLLECGIWQKISSELFDGELIERQVTVESIDHPLTIRPHRAGKIHLVTVGIGITRQIEPPS